MKYKRLLFALIPLFFYLFIPYYTIQYTSLIIAAVYFFSFLYSFSCYKLFKVSRLLSTNKNYCQTEMTIELLIKNRTILPVFNLLVIDQHGALISDGKQKNNFSFLPFEETRMAYTVKGSRRGEYTVGNTIIIGSDPIGFFPWQREVATKANIIIYPHIFQLSFEANNGLAYGSINSDDPVYEDASSIQLIREYTPGDSLNRINWKVSARMGSLYTMVYQPTINFKTLILLNLTEADYPLDYRYHNVERTIEAAASLIFKEINNNQMIGMLTTGTITDNPGLIYFPPDKQSAAAIALLEILARINVSFQKQDISDFLFNSKIPLPWGYRLFYVGPLLEEEQLLKLMTVKRKGLKLELFLTINRTQAQVPKSLFKVPVHYLSDRGHVIYGGF